MGFLKTMFLSEVDFYKIKKVDQQLGSSIGEVWFFAALKADEMKIQLVSWLRTQMQYETFAKKWGEKYKNG